VRAAVCLILCVAVTGCSSRRHFVNLTPDHKKASPAQAGAQPPGDSLETFMAKVRKLSEDARPDRPASPTVEGNNPALAAAVAAATFAPSPATCRLAAEEYRRAEIFDKAFQYLGKAAALNPQDAATYDALARLWRDSGLAHLALGDAHRAAYFAPLSPIVHNTLGTIFQALGRRDLARAEYQRALQLEPTAAYALNNLCYGWVLENNPRKAIAACENALKLQPDLAAAHNNLGLAHAINGDMAAAKAAFAHRDKADELYNTGIVYLAQHQYNGAVDAFESALAERPSLAGAAARARQARAAAAQARSEE
jgi:Flp pilus assembly protein TadD